MNCWRRSSLYIIVGVLLASAPSRADSIFQINFDDLFPQTVVKNQYSAWGVQFGTHLLDTQPDIVVGASTLAQSQPNVLASAYQNADGVISFSILPGASNVSFTAVSVEDGVTARYYDSQGSLLSTDQRPGTHDFYTPLSFAYASPFQPIRIVVIQALDGATPDQFAIDNVAFTLVPEPATLLLFGLAFLGVLRRRP